MSRATAIVAIGPRQTVNQPSGYCAHWWYSFKCMGQSCDCTKS